MRLREPNIHYVYEAEEGKDPRAFIKGLSAEAAGAGVPRWEYYHRNEYSETLETTRRDIGAESARDIGVRVKDEIRDLEVYASLNNWYTPERNLVFWIVSHNDSQRALIQHEMGAGESAAGYTPGLSEIVEFRLANHRLTTTFKDNKYELELTA